MISNGWSFEREVRRREEHASSVRYIFGIEEEEEEEDMGACRRDLRTGGRKDISPFHILFEKNIDFMKYDEKKEEEE